MCGIWGISDMGEDITRQTLANIIKKLMMLAEVRGKDASGIAVMQEDKLCVLRKAKASHELLNDVEFVRYLEENILESDSSNIWIMGHSRLVTNGTQYNPKNNQPVSKENMAIVHNGIIVNEDELWIHLPEHTRECEVDSEVILETFRKKYRESRDAKSASDETYSNLNGMASTILMMQEGHHMIAATNNGSLYECHSKDGKLRIFASERLMLEKLILTTPELKKLISEKSITQLAMGKSVVMSDAYTGEVSDIEIIQDSPTENHSPNLSKINYSKYEIDFDRIRKIKRCSKCVLPETMPFIEFDRDGVCNYCRGYRKMSYMGKAELDKWNDDFHKNNKTAMISFSGGRDSSYGLHYFVKEMGIKPVAYCYDWGMVTDLARRNQSRMCEKLGIEFILVSADLKKKRNNIKKNVEAWLRKPSLGMVPIFMAGDKQYYYYANKVMGDYKLDTTLMATNPLEKTYFKFGFCGVKPDILKEKFKKLDFERLPASDVLKMSGYYVNQFVGNPAYINSSIIDTATATASYYVIPHNYFRLYEYIPWDEELVDKTLISEYGWELANDTETTWRIGDGTAPFYNYIYCMVAGFTENDTLRSNQIREGMLDRDKALELVYRDNKERFDSMRWYFDVIGVNMEDTLKIVSEIPKRYE
ncbi:hypothetical protein D6855_12585 [Butyrivibrio sp. CB08]|uniref:hypothetical protein n=1 Tax=Butyrivibrio sp. CB08 TaxID=2364879 RepID=UPI000EA99D62|nr:hypothetical protein [Butyrivibrio sp. CB08]RKM57880.1 hypothetical protein D6855_12585 [Butyrivibrio sp. CB08]